MKLVILSRSGSDVPIFCGRGAERMCGIAGVFGHHGANLSIDAMVSSQRHRGPDSEMTFVSPSGKARLGHNRLSIIDLSPAGNQPMASRDGRLWIVFNGEIYNYLELRSELNDYPYYSQTDTEVILAAYERWGDDCLDRFVGMFSFLLWDEKEQRLFAARDRFGVKPLYYFQQPHGALIIASEIRALHAAGVPRHPDSVAWSTYLTFGLNDHSDRTFWEGIKSVPAGHALIWQDHRMNVSRWYNLAERVGAVVDDRPVETVQDEYLALLIESVKLRLRSDVPVGINLSGGLDSALLLGLVHAVQGAESEIFAYTFATGDTRYDEVPWVEKMLCHTRHPAVFSYLNPSDVPALAASVQEFQDEPYGGLPTLAYASLFELARKDGVTVLLDGLGMDEQWAGYDYYNAALNGMAAGVVQGTTEQPCRPKCLTPEFRSLAEPLNAAQPFFDKLGNLQYRDTLYTKLPRSLRFNDRISMRSSTELREPFLDHRLFELALRQPVERKIVNGTRKWLLREIARQIVPNGIVEAPKRPLQTPQREWLRGDLREWADGLIEQALAAHSSDWLDPACVRRAWREYCHGAGDNSFFVWQWISLGLMTAGRGVTRKVRKLAFAI